MPDFKDLENRLNANTDLRDRFIKNPAAVLRGEGINLTAAQGRELTAAIAKVKVPRTTGVKGAKPIRIIIKISVGIG